MDPIRGRKSTNDVSPILATDLEPFRAIAEIKKIAASAPAHVVDSNTYHVGVARIERLVRKDRQFGDSLAPNRGFLAGHESANSRRPSGVLAVLFAGSKMERVTQITETT
jgi:hypothetical protein